MMNFLGWFLYFFRELAIGMVKIVIVMAVGYILGLIIAAGLGIDAPFVPVPQYAQSASLFEDPPLHEEVLHSPEVFRVNYEEMEKKFKVYMYDYERFNSCVPGAAWTQRDTDYLNGIFRNSLLVIGHKPDSPDLFFIPIPCKRLNDGIENGEIELNLSEVVYNHPHWNRSLGADHFYITCDDIRVIPTEHAKFLEKNSICGGCSGSYNDSQHKDVALPHFLPELYSNPGGTDLGERTKLGFWVGQPDSNVRSQLISLWKNDQEVEIRSSDFDAYTHQYLYSTEFNSTKYCICPRGGFADSPCLSVAIHYGCVPVILSDYYVLPFNDILDWSQFSVILKEANVHRLKEILQDISFSKYKKLQANVAKVQRHFRWNIPPRKYDAFSMVMYELWLRHHVIRY